jgi:hypothetical protein
MPTQLVATMETVSIVSPLSMGTPSAPPPAHAHTRAHCYQHHHQLIIRFTPHHYRLDGCTHSTAVKTLPRAQLVSRTVASGGGVGVTVELAGTFPGPLVLTAADAGSTWIGAPTTLQPSGITGAVPFPRAMWLPAPSAAKTMVLDPQAAASLLKLDLLRLPNVTVSDIGHLSRHGFTEPGTTPPMELFLSDGTRLTR